MNRLALLTLIAVLALTNALTHPPNEIFVTKPFPWRISHQNTWSVFPNFTVPINLLVDSLVDISYKISGEHIGLSHILTRVLIDGE